MTWRFTVEAEPRGKAYVAIAPRGSRFAQVGLTHKCEAFEREVARVAALVLPQLEPDAMLGISVVAVKQRPKRLLGEDPARIPCPVKPDATNVLKCVEDSLMRCRECQLRKRECTKKGKHTFTPTLVDDARVIESRSRTYYSSVDRRGPKRSSWVARPSRVEVHVWVLDWVQ